jgi:rod shape-determining protein MreD
MSEARARPAWLSARLSGSGSMRWLRFAVLVVLATVLQTSVVGVIALGRPDLKPDLLLILLVFFAIRADPQNAVLTSFAIGFAADLSSPVRGLMGPQIISFGAFGTLLSDVHSIISIRRMPYQAVAIFLMGFLTALLSHLLTFFRAEPAVAHAGTELFWQPLYSAVLGPFLFFPIAWWMRMAPKGTRAARTRRR